MGSKYNDEGAKEELCARKGAAFRRDDLGMSLTDTEFSCVSSAEEASINDLTLAMYAPSSYALVIKVT